MGSFVWYTTCTPCTLYVQSYKDELAHVPLTSCRRCVCTLCNFGTAAIILAKVSYVQNA